MSTIVATFHIDANNADDSLVFNVDGMRLPNGSRITWVDLTAESGVADSFKQFADSASMALVISFKNHGNQVAIYRLFALAQARKSIYKAVLDFQERVYQRERTGQWKTFKPKLRLSALKVDGVIPLVVSDDGHAYFQANFSVNGRHDWTELEGQLFRPSSRGLE